MQPPDTVAVQLALGRVELERDVCASRILAWLRLHHLHFEHPPQHLLGILTAFGTAVVDIGVELAHNRGTDPAITVPVTEERRRPSSPSTPAVEPPQRPRDRSRR
jgi:hypothetical protein